MRVLSRRALLFLAPLVACNAILGTPDPARRTGDAGVEPSSPPRDGAEGGGEVVTDAGDATTATEAEASCPADASSDPDNCGACGHSCQGGACVSGMCQPVLLAGDPDHSTGLFSLWGMTFVDGGLFGTNWYASAGLVYTIDPLTDAGLHFLVPSNPAYAASPIASDGERIFYVVYQDVDVGLWVMNLDGSSRQRLASYFHIGTTLADDRYVYFVLGGQPGVHRMDKDGKNEVVSPLPGSTATDFRVLGGQVYVSQTDLARVVTFDRENVDAVSVLSSTGDAGPGNVTVDDDFVYWNDTASHFWRHPRSTLGGSPTEITPPNLPLQPRFTIDDQYVWEWGNGKIIRFPKDGSGNATLVYALPNGDLVYGFAQDARTIYFGSYGGGYQVVGQPYSAIYKLAK
jgi:hypothetical protein